MRMLEEKSKFLRWLVDKVPYLRDIEMFRTAFSGYCEDTFWAYKTVKTAQPIFNKLTILKNKLKTEIWSDSEKQTLCNQVERLVEKLDEIYSESIQKIKPKKYRSRELVDFSNIRSHYRDLIKQYGHSKDCGNQNSLVSSTSAVDKDPYETVIDTGIWNIRKGWGEHKEAENNQLSLTRDHREDDRSKKLSSKT